MLFLLLLLLLLAVVAFGAVVAVVAVDVVELAWESEVTAYFETHMVVDLSRKSVVSGWL